MKKSNLPTPAALKAEAKSQLRALSQELAPDAPEALAPARVHGARRRIKRLRSLLRLLRKAMGEHAFERANAQLKRAADSLADQRRADALLAASRRLGSRKQAHALQAVAEANKQEHAGDLSGPDGLKTARRAVTEAARAVSSSRLELRSPLAIADGLIGHYRRARKELGKSLKTQEAEALHVARKKIIDHLHHIELLKPNLPSLDAKRLKRLDELREALGDLNDLDEQQQLAAARQVALPGKDARAIEKRRERLLQKAEQGMKLLFKEKPKAFARRMGVAAAENPKSPAKDKGGAMQDARAGATQA